MSIFVESEFQYVIVAEYRYQCAQIEAFLKERGIEYKVQMTYNKLRIYPELKTMNIELMTSQFGARTIEQNLIIDSKCLFSTCAQAELAQSLVRIGHELYILFNTKFDKSFLVDASHKITNMLDLIGMLQTDRLFQTELLRDLVDIANKLVIECSSMPNDGQTFVTAGDIVQHFKVVGCALMAMSTFDAYYTCDSTAATLLSKLSDSLAQMRTAIDAQLAAM